MECSSSRKAFVLGIWRQAGPEFVFVFLTAFVFLTRVAASVLP